MMGLEGNRRIGERDRGQAMMVVGEELARSSIGGIRSCPSFRGHLPSSSNVIQRVDMVDTRPTEPSSGFEMYKIVAGLPSTGMVGD